MVTGLTSKNQELNNIYRSELYVIFDWLLNQQELGPKKVGFDRQEQGFRNRFPDLDRFPLRSVANSARNWSSTSCLGRTWRGALSGFDGDRDAAFKKKRKVADHI